MFVGVQQMSIGTSSGLLQQKALSALLPASSLIIPTVAYQVTRLHARRDSDDLPVPPAGNNEATTTTTTTRGIGKMLSDVWATNLGQEPRYQSVVYMAAAMALHFGGYEFFRNSCLGLFTSTEYGFSSPAAFPLANACVSPFSLILLWGYTQQLDTKGPRIALKNTTLLSMFFIATAAATLWFCKVAAMPRLVGQVCIALTFLFQNSYQYLLYTQYWSFVGSVLTPDEGSRWFAYLGGFSSVVCSIIGGVVPYILPHTGLYGLMACTCLTLAMCLVCGDHAYALGEKHSFDPKEQMKAKQLSKLQDKPKENRIQNALNLFGRVPTLKALFLEVITWQSLNTILGVAFVTALKANIADDMARSAYSSIFYSYVNGASSILQFIVIPRFMKFAEPRWIWRVMPLFPLIVCFMQMLQSEMSLTLVASAMFIAKVTDYSIRTVVYNMVYQPLDFESRYVGKEILGVFGSRFGKSGMSLVYVNGRVQKVPLLCLVSTTHFHLSLLLSGLLQFVLSYGLRMDESSWTR